uniref:HECT-type E3 ubiquitin transferase n=1 Tax=Anthurium amnicola TaxID=1678845 RepID=A0A1D1Z229_9ARAE
MSDAPREMPLHRKQQQVSLRGASAKDITRDVLLHNVSQEREVRSYKRRALAAVLFIQRVWRRYHVMRKVADQLQQDWEILVNHRDALVTSTWISTNLLRPFLLFAAHPSRLQEMLRSMNTKPIFLCFQVLLQSIDSTEPVKNFCSLAVGTHEEKSIWLCQAKKLVSLCLFILAECGLTKEGEDRVQLAVLGMRLTVSLTDPLAWKIINGGNIRDAGSAVNKLLNFLITTKCGPYNSIRSYMTKLDANIGSVDTIAEIGGHFLITASAITLALRPFYLKSLSIDNINVIDVEHVVEQYCTFVLTIPCLTQRLPPVLLPALRHESSLLPCLNVHLISQGKIISEMLKWEESSRYSTKVIPPLLWFLANIINLTTEYVDDSGQFIKGLNLKAYACVVNCISETFLHWVENTGRLTENANDEHHATVDASTVTMIPDLWCKLSPCDASNLSYIGLLKPVHQQWHLRYLLSVTEKGIVNQEECTAAVNQSLKYHGNLEFLEIVLFYHYMLRLYSFLDPLVGPLPILNMLSFTPGFVGKLWEQVEHYIFHNNGNVIDANKGCVHKCFGHNDGDRIQTAKGYGNKWVNVLAKITGKSRDLHLSDLNNGEFRPSQIDNDAYDLWDIEPLRQGSQGISRDLQCVLNLFCSVYAHLLLVLDDIEFYDKQVPFNLWQQQRISSVLNTFVYGSFIHNCALHNRPLMDAAIRCLHLLYERDCRHKFCPPSLWVAPARRGRLPIAAAARSHEAISANHQGGNTSNHRMSSVISTIPHVFPFEERVQMFREFIKLDKGARRVAGESTGPGSGSTEIVIRRHHIVEDGFRQLNLLGSKLKSCFNISFVSECGLPEAGLDYGGLSKEFLTDISKAAFDPKYGLFCQTSTSEGLLIPATSARFLENGIEMIEFLGRIVGKALYEGILLDYSFSVSFVQKLLGRYSFLDELSTLDPELYRNLIYVKHYQGDAKELALDFTITEEICGRRTVIELKPGGKDMPVTNDNKLQYIYAIADYKLNQQVLPLANAFYRGLTDLISPSWLSIFTANEFNQVEIMILMLRI